MITADKLLPPTGLSTLTFRETLWLTKTVFLVVMVAAAKTCRDLILYSGRVYYHLCSWRCCRRYRWRWRYGCGMRQRCIVHGM